MLSTAEKAVLVPYIRQLADMLGLKDWKVLLLDDECEDVHMASVNIPDGIKSARMRLCATWSTFDADEKRATILHELLHCHEAGIRKTVQNDLPELMGRPAWSVFFAGWDRHAEIMVDGIAEAIAPLFPAYPDVAGE